MTEPQWLADTDPGPMLTFLANKASDRKLRLFACACSRQVWDEFTDQRCQAALTTAEQFADGEATLSDLTTTHAAVELAVRALEQRWGKPTRQAGAARAAETAARPQALTVRGTPTMRNRPGMHAAQHASNAAKWTMLWARSNPRSLDRVAETLGRIKEDQAALLRDVVGNPFRPISVQTAWLTQDVVAIAQAAYDDRKLPGGTLDSNRTLILADALEDAGCTDTGLLDHLRSPGPHVRGCWAVDALLGHS